MLNIRLLGEEMDVGMVAWREARKWVLDHGGATHISSWGKMWLHGSTVFDVEATPFVFSSRHNNFIARVCDNVTLMTHQNLYSNIVGGCGCMPFCDKEGGDGRKIKVLNATFYNPVLSIVFHHSEHRAQKKMWKLKLSEGNDPWLKSVNKHVGRQFWEFDPHLGTPEERAQVENDRNEFTKNRFLTKHSSDLLMRFQVICLYGTGALNTILHNQHRQEMCRYLYNHQVSISSYSSSYLDKSCI
ncbi:hypothetical protein NC651_014704 [Populus alba x Populus x berolinensis]|nr:hypothetical protein NC651_014704 [Populus alba x Populus x berolinensis]